MPVVKLEELYSTLLNRVSNYHRSTGKARASVGVSGGVDSAVMLGLAVGALGADKVTAIHSRINTNQHATRRANEVAEVFGVKLINVKLDDLFIQLAFACHGSVAAAGFDQHAVYQRIKRDPTVTGSLRSTLRAPTLRYINRLTGDGIIHGTGTECEDRWLRFYQKGGDGDVDTAPLSHLSKGEIYQLARVMEIPHSVLTAIPSPDLWGEGETHYDEDELESLYDISYDYSQVDPETGEYVHVGLIERISRFFDEEFKEGVDTVGWGDDMLWEEPESQEYELAMSQAVSSRAFSGSGLGRLEVRSTLESARAIERATKHKDAHLPALGNREDLILRGVLTNHLPILAPL